QQVLGVPARIGQPFGVGGVGLTLTHPMYATAIGLLRHGARQYESTGAPGAGTAFLQSARRAVSAVLDRFGL
ncbi:MAG TPA: hypothetical protein VGS41_13900, partial [Chthonomonadales bacterium]|nr:hypothetical protein [Chthonomonadales bacterium]